MTKKEILEMTGLSEQEFYQQYPTQEAFEMAMGGMVDEYKKGGWIQKATASIKKRGTEGVCTGSKFGGPSCRPGTKRYALAKTFRKMAKARKKEDGGEVVDVYQLMGMPTPEMYEMGGYAMMEDYGRGGMIKRKDGSYSKRGLWDNIRANRGSGRKPTKEMLKQEKKIRAAEKKEYGGMVDMYGMGGTTNIGDLSHVFSQKNHSNMGMAMGGAINYPEGLQMPIFAMGGMTGPLTKINVEKGELLTDKNGKIVTEYKGGGMVPHPEEGIDERGTVPAQEGMFVITKRMADKYKKAMKNHDKLYADTIRNNIAFDKAKKEAAEEQAAMTAYDKFTAKYGGAVQRMYARGGSIPKYDRGGLNLNNPAFNNNNFSFNNPNSSFSGSMDFLGTPNSLNLDYSPMTMGQYRTGQTGSYMDYRNIPDTGIGYKGADTPPSDPNNFNYKDFMSQAIPYGVAASQVIEPLLQKPFKMNSQDYETPADLKARLLEGERGRREMRGAYANAKYNARQLGSSNVFAGLQAGSTAYQRSIADYEEALENKNRMIQSDVDRVNKTIQQSNLNQRMQMAMFNEQNKAARRNAIRQGLMNTAGTYYNQQANQMTKEGLSAAYPDYQFSWNKKKSS